VFSFRAFAAFSFGFRGARRTLSVAWAFAGLRFGPLVGIGAATAAPPSPFERRHASAAAQNTSVALRRSGVPA
jgi:hypothetical protein